jgi:hypothetical protein
VNSLGPPACTPGFIGITGAAGGIAGRGDGAIGGGGA